MTKKKVTKKSSKPKKHKLPKATNPNHYEDFNELLKNSIKTPLP